MIEHMPFLPKAYEPWLYYQQFLTEKLRKTSKDASLTVLQQNHRPTGWWEKFHLLILEPCVFLREIAMLSHGIPCWYARTIIPNSTYEKQAPLFSRLQEEILGNILFESPSITRSSFSTYAIDSTSLEYYWLRKYPLFSESQQEPHFWARLSTFTIEAQFPLYLLEILLPGLLKVTS